MAHYAQQHFCLYVKNKFPFYFKDCNVLDVGSLDINGCNRHLFDNCSYIGIDIGKGRNVDVIAYANKYDAPDESFNTIISTECFEHDKYWKDTMRNIVRMLKKNGLFVFTCASTGRLEHGTSKSEAFASPFTVAIEDWKDYYMNLTEKDIRSVLDIDTIFSSYEFYEDKNFCDLYFWGNKR